MATQPIQMVGFSHKNLVPSYQNVNAFKIAQSKWTKMYHVNFFINAMSLYTFSASTYRLD